jgi:hypothetical protein
MTPITDLLAETARLGVRLAAHGDRLRVEAPAGVVTPQLRATLAARKPDLLPVVWRLEEMRRLAVTAPRAVVYARVAARGGPGWCFSCGDPLEPPSAYGRCASCDVAADLFYASRRDGSRSSAHR